MKQVFPIVPAGTGAPWATLAIALLLLGLLLLFGFIFYSTRNVSFEVSAEGLRIRGDLYGRLVPRASLALDQARILNLGEEREYALSWRTNGIGDEFGAAMVYAVLRSWAAHRAAFNLSGKVTTLFLCATDRNAAP